MHGWTRKAMEAYSDQWLPYGSSCQGHGEWDWPEIFRRHQSDFKTLDMVIWGPGDRLSGLALARVTNTAIVIDLIEGDPRSDCPLQGLRAAIILEASACYAQGVGRNKLRLTPVNDHVAAFYEKAFDFVQEKPKKGAPYHWREV